MLAVAGSIFPLGAGTTFSTATTSDEVQVDVRRTRRAVSFEEWAALEPSIKTQAPITFTDTFYDTFSEIWWKEEIKDSLFSKKCWLILREYSDGSPDWILKAYSQNTGRVMTWQEVRGEENILAIFKKYFGTTTGFESLPSPRFPVRMMQFKTCRYTLPGITHETSWLDICGSFIRPLAIYAVISTDHQNPIEAETPIAPSKTKVMMSRILPEPYHAEFQEDPSAMEQKLAPADLFAQFDAHLQLTKDVVAFETYIEQAYCQDSTDEEEDDDE